MLLLASVILVVAPLAVFLINIMGSPDELHFGFQQMIHARIPWLLLGALWLGGLLGVAALVKKWSWGSLVVVALELLVVAGLSFMFLGMSNLPDQPLAIAHGDEFPAYTLTGHDGREYSTRVGEPRPRALYIFYRGDW